MIHPTADVSTDAVIGEGTVVWHHAQIREGATVGTHCVVATGAYVDHDVTIGANCKLQNGACVYFPARLEDGVFVGPGALITNDRRPRAVNPDGTLKHAEDWSPAAVTIRRGAAIGAGAIVLPGVVIGQWALVGAGAVVAADVPDHALFLGIPARLAGWVCACGRHLSAPPGESPPICEQCAAETSGTR